MGELLTFDVGQHGQAPFLATRIKGRAVREDLEGRIARSRPDGVVIDFGAVEAMTISFADEFLGRFYASLAAGDVPASAVLLARLNDENLETVSICLERRDLAAAAVSHGQPVLLGAPAYLVETYNYARSLGTFSALDLSAQLSISPQNVNNRLKRLVGAGALRRQRVAPERGGKEFAYTIPPELRVPAGCAKAS